MAMSMLSTRTTSFTGAQVRAQRPTAARPQRFNRIIRMSEGSESPMSKTTKAERDVENSAAPEGDRALEGEKAQLSGKAAGAKEYDPPHPEGAKGDSATTPAGQSSGGVANDKSESAKGTH